jgi:hypothetical protein
LRKSKPFTAWLCFFLAVSIIGVLFINGLSALARYNGSVEALKATFTDYKRSIAFKEITGNYFRELYDLVANPSTDSHSREWTIKYLDNEGENLIYYAANKDSGLSVKNIEGDLPPISGGVMPDLPAGYKYYWYFDGQKVWVAEDGQLLDMERLDSSHRSIVPRVHTDNTLELADIEVFLAVKDNLVKNPYGHSQYYMEQQFMKVLGWMYIALLAAGIALLVYALIRRREKREFDRVLASWSGKMWLEVKAALSLLVLSLAVACSPSFSGGYVFTFEWVLGNVLVSGFVLFGLWWFYLMLVDLINNGKSFFYHNSINSLLAWYRKYESRYPWQKSMLNRAYLLVAAEVVLALMSVLFLLAAVNGAGGLALLAALLIAGAGMYLIYRYLKLYDETLSDLGRLMDHIELVKNGDMKTRLEVPADPMSTLPPGT